MECVKEELKEMKKMLEFLVRRERKVDVRTEVAVKKLQRLEEERDEENDKEREASLGEALANMTKVVKLLVDKWFVDKGYGFGKSPYRRYRLHPCLRGAWWRSAHDRHGRVGAKVVNDEARA